MIIGDFGAFPPPGRSGICQRQFARCVRVKRTRNGRLVCLRQLNRCRRGGLHGADELGAVEPYVTMAAGSTPSWNPRDTRSALTTVGAMTYQQEHPQMNGVDFSKFRLSTIWKWLKGEK